MKAFLNFAAFQLGWLACVGGAAAGKPWLGPLAVLALVGGQWALQWRQRWMLWLFAAAMLLGYAADSLLATAGALSFPAQTMLGGPSPLWMAALWVNFAATLDASLGWLQGRPLLAAALGAAGGPLAYWGGEKFGAIQIAGAPGLAAVATEWALATPALLGAVEWLRRGDER